MALTCNNQGMITLNEVIAAVNTNETTGIDQQVEINANNACCVTQQVEIGACEDRLDLIEGGPSVAGFASAISALQTISNNNENNITNVATDLVTTNGLVTTANDNINNITIEISSLETATLDNADNIGLNTTAIASLVSNTGGSSADLLIIQNNITALQTDLTSLTTTTSNADTAINTSISTIGNSVASIETDYAAANIVLSDAITSLETNQATLTTAINDNATDVTNLGTDLDAAILNITQNATDIGNLSGGAAGFTNVDTLTNVSATNLLLTQLDTLPEIQQYTVGVIDTTVPNLLVTETEITAVLQNFSIISHKAPLGADGGSSFAGVWTTRELNDMSINHLGITLVGNRLQIDAGTYLISGFAVATGAHHQSRLFDETSAVDLCLGSSQSLGHSHFNSVFTLAAAGTVVLQTQVDVDVAGTGFGEANPFGEAIFSTIKIEKIGE